ncbi:hypothetical protein GCM10009784_13040 [Arthrobacter parietis]|uniref:Uncharacterized protein n=1 Tax=Arthrobacter parietis TaxID=271434 RepID=A0ABN3AT27_9MICC
MVRLLAVEPQLTPSLSRPDISSLLSSRRTIQHPKSYIGFENRYRADGLHKGSRPLSVRLVDPFAAKCPHSPEEAPGCAEFSFVQEVFIDAAEADRPRRR